MEKTGLSKHFRPISDQTAFISFYAVPKKVDLEHLRSILVNIWIVAVPPGQLAPNNSYSHSTLYLP